MSTSNGCSRQRGALEDSLRAELRGVSMASSSPVNNLQHQSSLADFDAILDRQWSKTISGSGSLSGTKGSGGFRQLAPANSKQEKVTGAVQRPNSAQEPQEAAPAQPGSSPGRLEVIDMSKLVIREVIGVGAIGKVHRGLYEGEEVAIKLLDCSKPGLAGDGISDWRRLGLMKELRVWRKLQHPNIVQLIGASPGVADKHAFSNVCCLVSEFMSGGTLRDYIMAHSKLGYKTVLNFALDIAKGLEYLHSRKIIHRDVKTRNIMLDSRLHAKIGDFDSARIIEDNPSDMSGEIGTFGYMAPEVMEGKDYDEKSDVYSFGICLLEIYTCEMAFNYGMMCLSLADITKGLVYRNMRPKIPKSCPGELGFIMKRCWKKNPQKRPTMSEVVKLLEDILSGNSITANRTLTSVKSMDPKILSHLEADMVWIRSVKSLNSRVTWL